MPRKYQVSITWPLQQQVSANASTLLINEKVDLAQLLSQRLQRNVRQGKVFHLHNVTASVSPSSEGDYDLGTSLIGEVYHCPATKNSVRAWQHLFHTWRKQKSLKVGAVGPTVRGDDFEVGWNTDLVGTRTSTVYTTGMNDTSSEEVVIFGDSSNGSEITLQDTYQSLQPPTTPSIFPLGGYVKMNKYTNSFPQAVKTPFHAHWTAKHSDNNTALLDWINVASGMTAGQSTYELQDTATLCGVLRVRGFIGPVDDATTVPDEAELTMTFTVSIGSSLLANYSKKRAMRRKSKSFKRFGSKSKYSRRRFKRRG